MQGNFTIEDFVELICGFKFTPPAPQRKLIEG